MEQENKQENRFEETMIEGRNAVLEAFRSGKTVDKLFVLDGCQDGPVKTITREAKKQNTIIHYVAKERLDQLSETGKHQGVIAQAAAYRYAEVEDMLKLAEEKGEPPFLFILDPTDNTMEEFEQYKVRMGYNQEKLKSVRYRMSVRLPLRLLHRSLPLSFHGAVWRFHRPGLGRVWRRCLP